MSYTILEECPDYLVNTALTSGHWTAAKAETFVDDHGVESHLHFYMSRTEARKVWSEIKHLVPHTINTVSFSE